MACCKTCSQENCKKHSFLIGKPRLIDKIQGSTPPEVFIGKWNYPNVYAGILAPQEYGDTKILSSPEIWHAKKLQINEVLKLRQQLIYGRQRASVKKPQASKLLPVLHEVAMTHKSVALELSLKKPIEQHKEKDSKTPLISNAAEINYAKLEENAPVKPKIDCLVNDIHAKSSESIIELDSSGIPTSSIIKLLSVGLLGLASRRKLVPTRWSITAVDDTLSKEKLKRIRYYPEIQDYQVFHAEYIGNHYEFLLLPEKWSFEVLEISLASFGVWHDYESFFPRKKYAQDVTGAYYANRLALTEYLDKIKRQASCIVLRQIGTEYYAPLGVGILRQISREAFSKPALSFSTLKEALENIQSRLRVHIDNYLSKSIILQNYGKQKKLSQFF